MPRYIWRAQGCPPYPRDVSDQLEDALSKGLAQVEITLHDRRYVIRLAPAPFCQFLASNRHKSRSVEREVAPPTSTERMQQLLVAAAQDPTVCCRG